MPRLLDFDAMHEARATGDQTREPVGERVALGAEAMQIKQLFPFRAAVVASRVRHQQRQPAKQEA